MAIDTQQSLEKALELHQAGQLPLAEAHYRHVLQHEPGNADALHLLGLLAYQTGRSSAAVELIKRAIAINPSVAQYHCNLGNAWCQMGRLSDAIAAYRQAINLQSNLPEAHNNLGLALQDDGQLDQAIVACRAAIEIKPDYAEAHNNLGNALLAKGDADQAISCYRKALAAKPELAEAHNNLGNALARAGQMQEAVACYRQAIALKKAYPEAHFNLGTALVASNHSAAAIPCFRNAIAIKPEYPKAYNNLGRSLKDNGELDEAIAAYHKAIAQRPDYAEAHSNLGVAFLDAGQADQAIACFRKVIGLKPEDVENHSHLLLALNYVDSDRQTLLAESRDWAQRHAEPLGKLARPHINNQSPARRLRIGYVSADFREHPCAMFLMPLLQNHDRKQVDTFCYAEVSKPDDITVRLQQHATVWQSTVGLTDEQVAKLIRKDRIDILVDLKLHTDQNRLLVFARKPAPIQMTWLGYPGTTGLNAIDYRVTDPYLYPVEGDAGINDAFYAETSIRLPDCFWCYDPFVEMPPVTALPALKRGTFTFGCLNNFCKVNERALELWARILHAIDGSRLLLMCDSPNRQGWARNVLEQAGIDAKRIEFFNKMPRRKYLELYDQIDLALDPMPCCGHTTTFDSLWMGVPVVTQPGPTAISRAGISILSNIGLTDFVAKDAGEYERIAIDLARDLPRLATLRAGLRQTVQQSPLMDGRRFARNMEAIYREVWQNWCAGVTDTHLT